MRVAEEVAARREAEDALSRERCKKEGALAKQAESLKLAPQLPLHCLSAACRNLWRVCQRPPWQRAEAVMAERLLFWFGRLQFRLRRLCFQPERLLISARAASSPGEP